jgi:hypothetical protein
VNLYTLAANGARPSSWASPARPPVTTSMPPPRVGCGRRRLVDGPGRPAAVRRRTHWGVIAGSRASRPLATEKAWSRRRPEAPSRRKRPHRPRAASRGAHRAHRVVLQACAASGPPNVIERSGRESLAATSHPRGGNPGGRVPALSQAQAAVCAGEECQARPPSPSRRRRDTRKKTMCNHLRSARARCGP